MIRRLAHPPLDEGDGRGGEILGTHSGGFFTGRHGESVGLVSLNVKRTSVSSNVKIK